ncbi:MAG: hypothetical protein LBR81_03245 [Prevotellaceae bacterium]|jgi:hypothetical protein|nr:hypothetical protein [Prevotellaceae bacterium]
MSKRIIILFFVGLLVGATANSQSLTVEVGGWDSLPRLHPEYQQKIYATFDKPYYAAGEPMWFRLHLLDASTHRADTMGAPVYVELIDERDSVVRRIKLQSLGGVYWGKFDLNALMPEGVYTVRAYTEWMRNAGSDFFFHRCFFIGNSVSSQLKTNVEFAFVNDRKGIASVRFMQKTKAFSGKKIRCSIEGISKKPKRLTLETNSQGAIYIPFSPKKLKGKQPAIRLFYEDSLNLYNRAIAIPSKNDFDVQLFPEGGNIISGTTNCVAFKAVGVDGLGVDVQGALYNDEDKKIIEFTSTHLGMGKFCYFPDNTRRYYTLFRTAKGETKRVNLPRPLEEGFGLAAVQKYDRILVSVKSVKGRMVSLVDSLRLVGHIRGTVFYDAPISGTTPAVMFHTTELTPGIAHFLLFDKKNKPVSERLVFVYPAQPVPQFEVDFIPLVNAARDHVTGIFQLTDFEGKPLANAEISVAITDDSVVPRDSTAENVFSGLWLSSDLKGFVEKPGLYFDPDYPDAPEALDLLMQTQGWRRYSVETELAEMGNETEEKIQPNYEEEKTVAVSGQLTQEGKTDKPLAGVQVLAYAPKTGYFNTQETDSAGYFSFKHLAFLENTQFTLQARMDSKLPLANAHFRIDEQNFPKPDNKIPHAAATPVPDSYLQAANEKYYSENGGITRYLHNGQVVAFVPERPIEETLGLDYRGSDEIFVLEGQTLDSLKGITLAELLKTIPDLAAWNEHIQPSAENPHREPIVGLRFVVDGNIYSFNEVKNIDTKQLEALSVRKPIYGRDLREKLDNTLIELHFTANNPLAAAADKQVVATTMPLGYAVNVLFYQPKYEFLNIRESLQPDLRSTIYWNPDVRTGGSGRGMFSFFMADKLSVYRIVVEGITENGEPCRYETRQMLFYKDYVPEIGNE